MKTVKNSKSHTGTEASDLSKFSPCVAQGDSQKLQGSHHGLELAAQSFKNRQEDGPGKYHEISEIPTVTN